MSEYNANEKLHETLSEKEREKARWSSTLEGPYKPTKRQVKRSIINGLFYYFKRNSK